MRRDNRIKQETVMTSNYMMIEPHRILSISQERDGVGLSIVRCADMGWIRSVAV